MARDNAPLRPHRAAGRAGSSSWPPTCRGIPDELSERAAALFDGTPDIRDP